MHRGPGSYGLAIAALALLAAAGCGGTNMDVWGPSTQAPSMAAPAPAPAMPAPAMPAPAPRPPTPAPRPAPRVIGAFGTADEVVAAKALPTGLKENSVLYVEKSAPKEILVGREFAYRIRLTNLTEVTLDDVTLAEQLPKGFTAKGFDPPPTAPGETPQWAVGSLRPRAAKVFTVLGSVAQAGPLVNCCRVTYKVPEVCLTSRAVQPALQVTKTAPADVMLCDPITYTVTVNNTGSGSAGRVQIVDKLPAGLTMLDGKTAVAYEVPALAAGQSREVTFQARAQKTGLYTNQVTATADGGLTAQAETKTMVRQPVLEVTKTGPAMRYVGRNTTYEITVANKGDAVAQQTVLTDTLPATATFVAASAGGIMSAGNVTWSLGDLAPSTSKKVTVTVLPSQVGLLRNTATATARCAKAAAEASTAIKGIPAILLECVDLEDPIEVGSNETYVITVTNQGSATGTNIVITCALQPEQGFVSADGPTRGTSAASKITFAPLPELAPKAKAVYRVVVKALKPGDVRFRASLNSDQMDSSADESESTHQYE